MARFLMWKLLSVLVLSWPTMCLSAPSVDGDNEFVPDSRVFWSAEQEGEPFDGFIVHYKNDLSFIDDPGGKAATSSLAAIAKDVSRLESRFGVGVRYERRLATGGHLIGVASKQDDASFPERFMRELAKNPEVLSVEVNSRVQPMQVVNDPDYSKQWGLWGAAAGINVEAAWARATGASVVVAVLDTGYTEHPDFEGQTVPGYDFISSPLFSRDLNGRDPDPRDEGDWVLSGSCGTGSAPADSSWHGSHVAGIIAARTDNGIGMAGIAYGTKIQHVRVLGRCGGTIADITDAIVWASGGVVPGVPANETPARVINLSLGGTGACTTAYQLAMNAARSRNALVVVAAGNENAPASGARPGNCSGVLSVAAVNREGQRARYSNYGNRVDIAAPGGETRPNMEGGIYSTVNAGAVGPTNPSYAWYQGTSMAAPHVSGVAALLISMKPQLTVNQLITTLKNSARPFPTMCSRGCGVGLLDADAATRALRTPLTHAPLSVAKEGYGSVKSTPVAINCGTRCSSAFPLGSVVTLKATPQAGHEFAGWTGGGCSGSDPVCRVEFGGARAVVATFRAKERTLTNGAVRSNLSMIDGQELPFVIDVPAGASDLKISISGGTGDADLHVRHESVSSIYCNSYSVGNRENCSFPTPMAGKYKIRLAAWPDFSGVELRVSYRSVSAGGTSLTNGQATSNLSIRNGALYYKIKASSKSENLRISTSTTGGGTRSNMYVRYGAAPTLSTYDCRTGEASDPTECMVLKPRSGTYYVMLTPHYSYLGFSGVKLLAKFDDYTTRQALNLGFSSSSTGAGSVVVRRVSTGESVATCKVLPCKMPLLNASFDLIATPARGMTDSGWRAGQCESITSAGNCRLKMSASRWVNANISAPSATTPMLAVNATGEGRGIVEIKRYYSTESMGACTSFPCRMGLPANSTASYLDTFDLVAIPDMGSNVESNSWTGCDSRPARDTCRIRVDRLENVSVKFNRKQ